MDRGRLRQLSERSVEPTLRAVNAMWPALLGGYAVDERRVYTAGHSGGATVAWLVARQSGQIAGVIASGQPHPDTEDGKRAAFAWFGTAGRADFNFIEVKAIDAALDKVHAAHRMEILRRWARVAAGGAHVPGARMAGDARDA